jgi:hypothetical protein
MNRLDLEHLAPGRGIASTAAPSIFGLRYLEEEAAEIYDIVGCMVPTIGGPISPAPPVEQGPRGPVDPRVPTRTGCGDDAD